MLNWNTIDTVLLDMDGTLLDLYFDNHFWQEHLMQRYAEIHAQPLANVRRMLTAKFNSVRGTQNWYCLDYWQAQLNLDIVKLKEEVQHLIAVLPHAEEFLKSIQNKKQTVLVTNAHQQSLNLKLEKTGIGRYFDQIISAHDYHQPKEELGFWNRLHSAIAFDPQRTLLIEDNTTILQTAELFGIAHLVAITKPDSRAEHQSGNGYLAVENLKPLLYQA